jgi:hypothetical protein
MISFFKHLGMVALALLPVLSSAALQTGKVQAGKITGNVTIIDAKSQRKPLATGAVFQEGARVETGVDSTAELVFSNGASLLLIPGTLLEIRTFRQVPSAGITDPYRQIQADPSPSVTEVELSRGKVIGEVRKLNALSTFTVKTPAGLTRIRGTVFTVEYQMQNNGLGNHVSTCVRGMIDTLIYGDNTGYRSIEPGWTFLCINHQPSIKWFVPQTIVPSDESPLEKFYLYRTPAEDYLWVSYSLQQFSTLLPEVYTTIDSMAQTAPKKEDVFPNGTTVPVKPYAQDVTDGPVTEVAGTKAGAPAAPVSMSNGGGGTTYDESLKKIYDNVNRSVEMRQLNPTPTGG